MNGTSATTRWLQVFLPTSPPSSPQKPKSTAPSDQTIRKLNVAGFSVSVANGSHRFTVAASAME